MTWQPIATAPKNEEVDVWLGKGTDRDVMLLVDGPGRRSIRWRLTGKRWRPLRHAFDIPVTVQPTHWTPIPGSPDGHAL